LPAPKRISEWEAQLKLKHEACEEAKREIVRGWEEDGTFAWLDQMWRDGARRADERGLA
jgi:hypothetical protein